MLLVTHVRDVDARLIGVKTDFFAHVFGVGSVIDHALRVVGIASTDGGIRLTPDKNRIGGLTDVDHVQPAGAARSP